MCGRQQVPRGRGGAALHEPPLPMATALFTVKASWRCPYNVIMNEKFTDCCWRKSDCFFYLFHRENQCVKEGEIKWQNKWQHEQGGQDGRGGGGNQNKQARFKAHKLLRFLVMRGQSTNQCYKPLMMRFMPWLRRCRSSTQVQDFQESLGKSKWRHSSPEPSWVLHLVKYKLGFTPEEWRWFSITTEIQITCWAVDYKTQNVLDLMLNK